MSGGGTRKVLAWGECPPPSSPGGGASPSPPVGMEPGVQTRSSGLRFWREIQ